MSSPVWLWLLCDEIPISWLCQYKLAVWWLELNDCVLTLIIIDINKYNLASWWSWPLHFCIAGSSTKRDYWPVKLLTIWKSTSDCFSQTKEIISLFLSFNIQIISIPAKSKCLLPSLDSLRAGPMFCLEFANDKILDWCLTTQKARSPSMIIFISHDYSEGVECWTVSLSHKRKNK